MKNLKSTEPMDPKKELELLEFIDGIPEPPKVAPMPGAKTERPFVIIPVAVQEFFNKMEYKPKVEKDGTIHIENYIKALNEFGIPFYGATTFTLVEPKKIIEKN